MASGVRVVAGSDNSSVTFVIPVKHEQGTLDPLFHAKAGEVVEITKVWEAFIDDGSSDGSWAAIEQRAAEDAEYVKAIRFRHNAGKTAAQADGWKASKGDIVFTMDADLQDDPEEISRFLEKMREGFAVVTGWTRDDTIRRIMSCRAGDSIYFEPLDQHPTTGVFNQPELESVLAYPIDPIS
jgi:glycosyltransferase involved in cell wall biosynthesis